MWQWIEENIVEVTGAFLALIYLFLEIKEKWPMWIVGLFSSAFYIFIFFQSKVYAQMGLNFYFFFVNAYGLYCWRFRPSIDQEPLRTTRVNRKTRIILGVISCILFVFIGIILDQMTDSVIPYYDALPAALSVVATWMVARKILEHWFIWIFVNFYSVILYYWLDMYPTSILYFIYGVMSIVGFFKWHQSMLKQSQI